VKQFDIRGAVIYNEQGTVCYPRKPMWYYFTLVRGQGLPIKISSTDIEGLRSVHDGVVSFLDKEARLKHAYMEERRKQMQAGSYRETYY
jgi:hypothetical protein